MDIALTYEGSVAVLTWNEGENRINLDSLARLNELLDDIENVDGPVSLVLTGSGKFFCNGLDLARFADKRDEFTATLHSLEQTIGRLLIFPAYTVAAINGHAFAGGALISCAFDYRVMREDRGYWCMNEAEIGLALDERLRSRRTALRYRRSGDGRVGRTRARTRGRREDVKSGPTDTERAQASRARRGGELLGL